MIKKLLQFSVFATLLVLGFQLKGQNCIQPTQFGSATIAQTGTTTVTTCAFAGEYSLLTFTTAGTYTIFSTGGTGNYITFTDNSNVPVLSGNSPLVVNVTLTGTYRAHISTNASCGTESACRTISAARSLPPPCIQPTPFGSATIAQTGTTTVTTCAFAGEYATGTFTSAGNYTINSTGGTGNFITVTNTNNIVLLSGNAPLAVTIPSVGIYRFHISTNNSCGTDASCHSVSVIGITIPGNDNCTNATTLAIPSSSVGTTFNATTETNNPGNCVTSLTQPGVWYTVVGNGNRFGADLGCSSGWDSKIFVYAGNCSSLTCVTGNDDAGPICPSSAAASVTWCSVPSTTYYILVTGFSSPNNFTISITETVVPTVVITPAAPSICEGNSVTLTASGASTYSWTSGPNNASYSVSPTVNTVYTVVATTSVSCTRTETVNVTVNPNPTISVNSGAICSGESFTINPSGALTYTIEGGNAIVNPNSNTTYTVIGTDALGCISQNPATSTVDVNPTPVITVNSGSICEGQSFTISPSGAATYTIEGGNAIVTPTSNSTYTVIGTSALGCVSQSAAVSNVTVNPSPVVSVNNGTICAGNTFTIVPSGASSYTVQGGNLIVNPSSNSSYTVIGESAQGCLSSNTATANLTVNPSPMVSITGQSLVCQGQTAVLTASGADTYSWNTTATTASLMVAPSASSVYIVNGTNASTGCSNSASFTITVDPCTGVGEVAKTSLQISIYPNPNTGEFVIESANGLNKTIQVMDLAGKVLLTISSDSDKTPVNITEFNNGVYMIRVSSADNNQTFRLIKQ